MQKDLSTEYDAWNFKKKSLAKREEKFFFKTGEIWWCSLGLNIGTESYGKGETFRRPILIIKKLSGNACIVVPLTSRPKTGTWFQGITLHREKKWVMLHQIRMIHSNRFQRRMAVLDDGDFRRVKQKLEALLELSDHHHPA